MISDVELKLLQEFAKKEMKKYPVTQCCILAEPEAVSVDMFLTKLKLWLSMLKMEIKRN